MLLASPVVTHIVLVPVLVITPVVSIVISLGLVVLSDSLRTDRCLLKSVIRLIFK